MRTTNGSVSSESEVVVDGGGGSSSGGSSPPGGPPEPAPDADAAIPDEIDTPVTSSRHAYGFPERLRSVCLLMTSFSLLRTCDGETWFAAMNGCDHTQPAQYSLATSDIGSWESNAAKYVGRISSMYVRSYGRRSLRRACWYAKHSRNTGNIITATIHSVTSAYSSPKPSGYSSPITRE